MDLLTETIKLVEASDKPRDELARLVGVSGRWLSKVVSGEIPDPSVRRVQALYNVLTAPADLG